MQLWRKVNFNIRLEKTRKFINLFVRSAIKFQNLSETLSAGLSKLHSRCPKHHFGGGGSKNFEIMIFLNFGQKVLDRVVKTAFYVTRGTFWGLKKRKHVHSGLKNHRRKSLHTEGMIPFVIYITTENNNRFGIDLSVPLLRCSSSTRSLFLSFLRVALAYLGATGMAQNTYTTELIFVLEKNVFWYKT